jgi:hypothetical protein
MPALNNSCMDEELWRRFCFPVRMIIHGDMLTGRQAQRTTVYGKTGVVQPKCSTNHKIQTIEHLGNNKRSTKRETKRNRKLQYREHKKRH